MGEVLIFDTESDGLAQDATKLHLIQIGTADGEDVTVYCDAIPGYPSIAEGLDRLRNAEKVICHNLINHDYRLVEKLYPGTLRWEQLLDTLVLSRLYAPAEKEHSLAAWGMRLRIPKGDFKGPWDVCTPEMVKYAEQDIRVGRALWRKVKSVLEWPKSELLVPTEQRFAWLMEEQRRNGFRLNIQKATELEGVLRDEQNKIKHELQAVFPPDTIQYVTPKKQLPRTKVVVFNPASRFHIADRLKRLGWEPKVFTDDGHPKLSETILRMLPYPQAEPLCRYLRLQKLLGQISDGKVGWLKVVTKEGLVHGGVNPIGCAPGRCSHSKPNMAQVDKKDLRARECWEPTREGWKLVGVDAEGLQARCLAHFLERLDGGAAIRAETEGDKKQRTDGHSMVLASLVKLGLVAEPSDWGKAREAAKRCRYACLFGAGDPKLGWTLKDSAKVAGVEVIKLADKPLGARVRSALMDAITGFETLQDEIVKTAVTRKFLRSPMGRRIPIRSKHSALVFLMQASEADVMKLALVRFWEACNEEEFAEMGVDYALCANVHDEVQIEARPEIAQELGNAFARYITYAGQALGIKCPLKGQAVVGNNWKDTH